MEHPNCLRVLYAEDEPDIREVGCMALEAIAGFEVNACPDGMSALENAETFLPEIIILDIMMPQMDGLETFRRMRALDTLENTPVVFMTARVQETEIAEYRRLGCADVIEKPFDPMTLGEQVHAIWLRESAHHDTERETA